MLSPFAKLSYTPKQIAQVNRELNGWAGWGNGQDSKNNSRKRKARNKARKKMQKESRRRNRGNKH